MACIINADNGAISGSAGVKTTADSTGVLNIQTNGTTAISISASQAVSFTNTPTFTGGTANGVLYLNGSKVATSGSALTFDGTQTLSLFATGNAVTNLEGSTTNNAVLRFRNGTTGALAGFYGNNSKELIFEANGTTEQMRLTSTGLGIGTTSPGAPLNVKKNSAGAVVEMLRLTNDGPGAGSMSKITFDASGTAYAAITGGYGASGPQIKFELPTSTSGSWDWIYQSTTLATLLTSGNLGIGTASPTQKLEVAGSGNAFVSNGQAIVSAGSGITYSARLSCAYNFPFVDTYLDSVAGASYSGQIIFRTSSGGGAMTERMRLDSSGNLGIGTSSPVYRISVESSGQALLSLNSTNANGGYLVIQKSGLATGYIGNAQPLISGAANTDLGIRAESSLIFSTNAGSERARITAGGNLFVGCTAVPSASVQGFCITGTSSGNLSSSGTSTAAYNHFLFLNGNGTVGSISTSGSTTTYSTSSDRRLKSNIVPAPSASDDIDAIQIVSHDWKAGGHTRYGMIAQDLHQVAPEAVSAGDDGEKIEKTWGVDYSKLVPMLVKEIQSLRARVAQLETK